jgi:hypothetical protein
VEGGGDMNGTTLGDGSLGSSGYGSQGQIGIPHEDPSAGVYGYTGGREGEHFGTLSSRSKTSSDEFRMELQSMINNYSTSNISSSASFSNPNSSQFNNGRPPSAFCLRGGDSLYDIPEGRSRDGVEDLELHVANRIEQYNNKSVNDHGVSSRMAEANVNFNRFSQGSGIAYLRNQNRNRHSLSHTTSFDSSFSNGNNTNCSNSNESLNNNNEGMTFFGSSGPQSLPLDTAAIPQRNNPNPYRPVIDGRTLFRHNSNTEGSGGAQQQQPQIYNNNGILLHRNNSLPRPHSIAAPQNQTFMQYRLAAKKRDFV